MRKVFWENPYQTQLVTKVADLKDNRVLFEDTIAFSFSGGQESDKAFVNGITIMSSEIVDNLIFYWLPDDHQLSVGEEVVMTIDWPRRYKLMRLHFAAELVLELVTRKLHLKKIGAHIGENKARIDFACNKNFSSELQNILTEYNEIIVRDMEIKTGFDDINNQRRYWEIEGFSKVPCGGTHVKSTAEVGSVSLKRINIGSGKERIEIKLIDPHCALGRQ